MSGTPTPPTTWAPGAVVPGTVYRIIRPIGQGGMGEVYEVEHDLLGTRRALKVMARHFAGREDLAERLRVEARGLARLKHPNLVEVYDLGTSADERIFFAMELLKGATLRELLRSQGKLSPAAAVRVLAQVLDGLDVAHAAGMLHRDVKPENVFVCRDGLAKLLDFGVAKAIDASTPAQSITGVGMTVGTPRYMSPEQAEGRPVDARTDVYSVGLVLWEVLLGRPPFDESDPVALAVCKIEKGVPSLRLLGGGALPTALCDAVDRACQADPLQRFPSAESFAMALRAPFPSALRPGSRSSGFPSPPAELGNATTVLAPVGALHGHAGPATEIDPALPAPVGGTVPLAAADDALAELTERIEAACNIDRDGPTRSAPAQAAMRGPTGTQMLPAVVASQRNPSSLPEARGAASGRSPSLVQAGGTPDAAAMVSGAAPPRAGSRWRGVAAGVAAFVVPVSAALIVGYVRFDGGGETPAETISGAAAGSVLHEEPRAAPTPCASAAAPDASAAPVDAPAATASTAAPGIASTAPRSPKDATRTTRTKQTSPPPPGTRPTGMPASGL